MKNLLFEQMEVISGGQPTTAIAIADPVIKEDGFLNSCFWAGPKYVLSALTWNTVTGILAFRDIVHCATT